MLTEYEEGLMDMIIWFSDSAISYNNINTWTHKSKK